MLLIFLRISKGWTVSTNTLVMSRLDWIVIFIMLIFYILLFVWLSIVTDPAVNLYPFESAPGGGIIIVRMLIFLWFYLWMKKTIGEEDDRPKKIFYLLFAVFATIWFLQLPFIVFIAHFLSDTVRRRVVFGFDNAYTLVVFALSSILFRPESELFDCLCHYLECGCVCGRSMTDIVLGHKDQRQFQGSAGHVVFSLIPELQANARPAPTTFSSVVSGPPSGSNATWLPPPSRDQATKAKAASKAATSKSALPPMRTAV